MRSLHFEEGTDVEKERANIPGIICDGAKASCAAKIAVSLDTAMLVHHPAMAGKRYGAHNGILREDAGKTISRALRSPPSIQWLLLLSAKPTR